MVIEDILIKFEISRLCKESRFLRGKERKKRRERGGRAERGSKNVIKERQRNYLTEQYVDSLWFFFLKRILFICPWFISSFSLLRYHWTDRKEHLIQ